MSTGDTQDSRPEAAAHPPTAFPIRLLKFKYSLGRVCVRVFLMHKPPQIFS